MPLGGSGANRDFYQNDISSGNNSGILAEEYNSNNIYNNLQRQKRRNDSHSGQNLYASGGIQSQSQVGLPPHRGSIYGDSQGSLNSPGLSHNYSQGNVNKFQNPQKISLSQKNLSDQRNRARQIDRYGR